jgi:DNA-binding protein Fis
MTQALLPAAVLGEKPVRGSRGEGSDLDTLTQDVVHHGLTSDDDTEDGLYNKIVSRVERELIYQVMKSCNNVQTKAASRLGINRNTLHKKLKEYDFEK